MTSVRIWVCVFLIAAVTSSCSNLTPKTTPAVTNTPEATLSLPSPEPVETKAEESPAIQKGLGYLVSRINPDLGLLNEAPRVAPNIYWLVNDNALAAFTFTQLGKPEMGAQITKSIHRFGEDANGLIDVVWGTPVLFPPSVARPEMLNKVGDAEIWQEFHDSEVKFLDWNEYADLAFLGALNAYANKDSASAKSLVDAAMGMYDGVGFKDMAFDGQYVTYKLAMALYASAVIQAPLEKADQITTTLLTMQRENGGFNTHYQGNLSPQGDTNTETTCWALLALDAQTRVFPR